MYESGQRVPFVTKNENCEHLSNRTGLVVTVDRAWETSRIYLNTVRTINGMVHFINTNNAFNVYVDRNKASNILLMKIVTTSPVSYS